MPTSGCTALPGIRRKNNDWHGYAVRNGLRLKKLLAV